MHSRNPLTSVAGTRSSCPPNPFNAEDVIERAPYETLLVYPLETVTYRRGQEVRKHPLADAPPHTLVTAYLILECLRLREFLDRG